MSNRPGRRAQTSDKQRCRRHEIDFLQPVSLKDSLLEVGCGVADVVALARMAGAEAEDVCVSECRSDWTDVRRQKAQRWIGKMTCGGRHGEDDSPTDGVRWTTLRQIEGVRPALQQTLDAFPMRCDGVVHFRRLHRLSDVANRWANDVVDGNFCRSHSVGAKRRRAVVGPSIEGVEMRPVGNLAPMQTTVDAAPRRLARRPPPHWPVIAQRQRLTSAARRRFFPANCPPILRHRWTFSQHLWRLYSIAKLVRQLPFNGCFRNCQSAASSSDILLHSCTTTAARCHPKRPNLSRSLSPNYYTQEHDMQNWILQLNCIHLNLTFY